MLRGSIWLPLSSLEYGWIWLRFWQIDLGPHTQGLSGRFLDRPLGGRVYLVTQMVPMNLNFVKSGQIQKIRVVYYNLCIV